MENATNGLIMAGSILIGVIIISLFVYMFSNMGSITKDFEETVNVKAVQKFNEPFEKYIGRDDLTTHDLVTVYNLKKDINNEAGAEILKVVGIPTQQIESDLKKFLLSDKKYECLEDKVKYSEETQKITYLEFKEVK